MFKKEPFDKIRSVVEKRKLFEQAVLEKSLITCRLDDDTILTFLAHACDKETLMGNSETKFEQQGLHPVVGILPIGEDRFFFNGSVKVLDQGVTITTDIEIFKLQRRKTLRVAVPINSGLTLNLTNINGKSQLRPAGIVDVSAGGMRIYLIDETQGALDVHSTIEGTLGLPSDKKISFSAQVMHLQMAAILDRKGLHYGISFVNPTTAFTNRMQALTFQMQKQLLHE